MKRLFSRGQKAAKSANQDRWASQSDPSLTAHAALDEVRDSGAARLTVAACTAAVAFALLWAGQVQVKEKVTGSGTIEPQGRIERIEHPDGGVVRDLIARDNAVLAPGAVLLHFDTDHIEREVQSIAARIATLDDEEERVRYLLHAEGHEVPTHRGDMGAASEAFWTEQMLFVAQFERIAAADRRIAGEIENATSRSEIAVAEQKIIQDQLDRYHRFADSGAVRLLDRERLQREALQLSGNIEDLTGRRLEAESAREENSRRRDELLAQRRRDAASRWTKIEEELVTLRQVAADLTARIERAEVRTVNGGMVHWLEVANAMEVVSPGDVIAEIVPPGTAYRAVISVSADRIGAIRPGMEVKLKIASYDFTRFGAISAQITEISPTSSLDDTGAVVFRVKVNIPDTVPTGDQPVAVRPGMTVTADILTGERSVLSYLLHPVRRIQDQSLSEA